MAVLLAGCGSKTSKGSDGQTDSQSNGQAQETVEVKYATGFSVRDSAGVRLVNVGKKERFALVPSDETAVPEGYTRVKVPVSRAIVMTMLQLSNFTALDAHDVVKGITGTKNLFNADILQRVKDGRIVKIGMEGNFDTEMVLAANPDVIFISPFKRGGYDAIKETGIQLIPHLGYQELDPLGQAEWVKFVGLFIGKVREANEVFAGIESRYNALKAKAAEVPRSIPPCSAARCTTARGTPWAARTTWRRFSAMPVPTTSSTTRRRAARTWSLRRCTPWPPMPTTGAF